MKENSKISSTSDQQRYKAPQTQAQLPIAANEQKSAPSMHAQAQKGPNASEKANGSQNQNTTSQEEALNKQEKLQKLQQLLRKPKQPTQGPLAHQQSPTAAQADRAQQVPSSAQAAPTQEEFERMQHSQMQKLDGLKNIQYQQILQLHQHFRNASLNQMMSSHPGQQVGNKLPTPNFQRQNVGGVHPAPADGLMAQQFNQSGQNDIQMADQIKSQSHMSNMMSPYRHQNPPNGPFLSTNPNFLAQHAQNMNHIEMQHRMAQLAAANGQQLGNASATSNPDRSQQTPIDGKMTTTGSPAVVNRNSLRNLKQNQNLFLSLQNKEDKEIRWKYTLLVLDNMLDQIMSPGGGFSFTNSKDFEIDFVKISENLPKLVIGQNYTTPAPAAGTNGSSASSKAAVKANIKSSEQSSAVKSASLKLQKTSIQPRICSKLWESLRKSLRESFKMELEFFDHTRQEIVQNHWTESLLMFKKRIQVYYENQDLLNFKQTDKKQAGINYVESELRAQRLIEEYCKMCERAEQAGITSRSKNNLMQIGQGLKEELQKEDKITKEDESMILADCDQALGQNSNQYCKIVNVMDKILNEVNVLHQSRENQIQFQMKNNQQPKVTDKISWTNVEIAQLLVAVYNLGEGEWYEIQKRLNFSTSGLVKTPNQVAHRWRSIKRVMKRDLKELNLKSRGQKLVTKHDWIINTLRVMNMLDHQAIGLKEENFKTLQDSVCVDPYADKTPYQAIIEKYQKDQQRITQERSLHRQNLERQRRQIQIDKQQMQQEQEGLPSTLPPPLSSSHNPATQSQQDDQIISSKQTFSQRFAGPEDNHHISAILPPQHLGEDDITIFKAENDSKKRIRLDSQASGTPAAQAASKMQTTSNANSLQHSSAQRRPHMPGPVTELSSGQKKQQMVIRGTASAAATTGAGAAAEGTGVDAAAAAGTAPGGASGQLDAPHGLAQQNKTAAAAVGASGGDSAMAQQLETSEERQKVTLELQQQNSRGVEGISKFQDQNMPGEKKPNIQIVRQQIEKFDGGFTDEKVKKMNQKQIKQVLDNLSGESSNQLNMSQNLKISQMGQQSSIHEVQPGRGRTKSEKMKNVNRQYERKSSAISSNNEFSLNSHTGGASHQQTNHQIQTSQIIKKDPTMQQQITINNNINITTIHNGPSHQLANPGVPSTLQRTGPQMAGSHPIHQNLSQNPNSMTRSVSAAFGKQKNNNLNLLLQNPLSQIQAPQSQQVQKEGQKNGLASLMASKNKQSNNNNGGGNMNRVESLTDIIRNSQSHNTKKSPHVQAGSMQQQTPTEPIKLEKAPSFSVGSFEQQIPDKMSRINSMQLPFQRGPSAVVSQPTYKEAQTPATIPANKQPVVSPLPNTRLAGMSRQRYLLEKLKQKKMLAQQQVQVQSQNSSNTNNTQNQQMKMPQPNSQNVTRSPNLPGQPTRSTSGNLSYKQMLLQKSKQQNQKQ